MTVEHQSFNSLAVALLESADRSMKQAIEGLSDEQLYYQPSAGANSIAWLAWHLSRWKDLHGAIISGQPDVWVSEGWAQRYGMATDASGLGDTAEQVAAFRPSRELLFGYYEAAHRSTVERVAGLTQEQLLKPIQYMPESALKLTWEAFVGTARDFMEHTGQIAYLRGLVTGPGWRA